MKAGPAPRLLDHLLDPPEFPTRAKYTHLEDLLEVAAPIALLVNAKGTAEKLGCKRKQSLGRRLCTLDHLNNSRVNTSHSSEYKAGYAFDRV